MSFLDDDEEIYDEDLDDLDPDDNEMTDEQEKLWKAEREEQWSFWMHDCL